MLDTQIQHLDVSSLQRLGHWLLRRIQHCRSKREAAELILKGCEYSEGLLREQWELQVKSQTQPLPRTLLAQCINMVELTYYKGRSKNQGRTAVEEVLRLRKACEAQQEHVLELQRLISNPSSDAYSYAIATTRIQEAKRTLTGLQSRRRGKERQLGVDQAAELSRLVNNPYFSLRMNAMALKTRLRDKLRSRKFELDPVERMARKFNGKHSPV